MPIRRRTNSAGLSVSDREIRSHSGTDGTVYLDGEPQQAFQASTICIRSLCGIRKGCHHHFDVVQGHLPGTLQGAGIKGLAGCTAGLDAAVLDLHTDLDAIVMGNLGQFAHALQMGIAEGTQLERCGETGFMDAGVFYDDGTHATFGSGFEISFVFLGYGMVGVGKIRPHGRHDQTVFDRHAIDGDWLEQMSI